jgi:hypothetical protein
MSTSATSGSPATPLSLNQQKEEIQRRLYLLRKEREAGSTVVATPVEGDSNGRPPLTQVLINGVTVSIGQKVAVVDDAKLLESADAVLGSLRDRTKMIYLGETGKVVACLPDYYGKPGVELQFVDDVKKFFFAECIDIGDRTASAPPSPSVAVENTAKSKSSAVKEREVLAPQDAAINAPAKSLPKWPAQKPDARSTPPPETITSSNSNGNGNGNGQHVVSGSDVKPQKDQQLTSTEQKEDKVISASQDQADAQRPELRRVPTGGGNVPPRPDQSPPPAAQSSSPPPSSPLIDTVSEDPSQEGLGSTVASFRFSRTGSALDPNTWLISAKDLKPSIPVCPKGYAPRHAFPSPNSRIPRLSLGSPAGLSPAKLSRLPIGQTRSGSRSPTHQQQPSPRRAPQGYSLGVASKPAAGPLVPYRSKTPVAGGSGISLMRCTLFTKDDVKTLVVDPKSSQGKCIVLRESHTSLSSVLSLCTRELGWGTRGCRVERLFDANTGREVSSVKDLEDGMNLVATTGDSFMPPPNISAILPRPQPAPSAAPTKSPNRGTISPSRRESNAQPTSAKGPAPSSTRRPTSPGPSPSSASALVSKSYVRSVSPVQRALTPTVRSRVGAVSPTRAGAATAAAPASTSMMKPIMLRVYVNGEYGDVRSEPMPYRSITVRPTHKSLASVMTMLARELGWNAAGRKVETIFSAAGRDITDLTQLTDGCSVVAASSERFIPPKPHSVLFEAAQRWNDVVVDPAGSPSEGAPLPQPVPRDAPSTKLVPATASASKVSPTKRAALTKSPTRSLTPSKRTDAKTSASSPQAAPSKLKLRPGAVPANPAPAKDPETAAAVPLSRIEALKYEIEELESRGPKK